jgi:hypothetical protein
MYFVVHGDPLNQYDALQETLRIAMIFGKGLHRPRAVL